LVIWSNDLVICYHCDDDNEKDYDIEEDDIFSSKLYNRWNYKKDFGEDA
jgi:hypothetical protein